MEGVLNHVKGKDSEKMIKKRKLVEMWLNRNGWPVLKSLDWEEGIAQEPMCTEDHKLTIHWKMMKDFFVVAYRFIQDKSFSTLDEAKKEAELIENAAVIFYNGTVYQLQIASESGLPTKFGIKKKFGITSWLRIQP